MQITCCHSSLSNRCWALIAHNSIYWSCELDGIQLQNPSQHRVVGSHYQFIRLDTQMKPFVVPGLRSHNKAPFGCCEYLIRIESWLRLGVTAWVWPCRRWHFTIHPMCPLTSPVKQVWEAPLHLPSYSPRQHPGLLWCWLLAFHWDTVVELMR